MLCNAKVSGTNSCFRKINTLELTRTEFESSVSIKGKKAGVNILQIAGIFVPEEFPEISRFR